MCARLLAVLGLLAAGCATARPPPAARGADVAQRQRSACAAGEEAPGPRGFTGPAGAALPGERVAEVRVEGRRRLPEAVIREAMRVQAGAPFDGVAVAEDVRALEALEVFEEVRVEAGRGGSGGLVLTYHVAERPFVERVFVEGAPAGEGSAFFFPSPGDVYDAAAVKRAGAALAARLLRAGHLDAAARPHAARVTGEGVDLCLTVEPGPLYRVRRVAFTGNRTLSVDELLRALARAAPEKDGAAINVEGGLYRADLVERGQMFVSSLAYDRGLLRFETLEPEVKLARTSPAEGSVEITFPLQEGPVFHVAAIGFSGALAAPAARYDALVDVHPGDVFSRSKVMALRERANLLHRELGRRDLEVNAVTELGEDTIRVTLRVEVVR